MVMHHVPVERCADILESMSGTRPSDGWVHKLLERAARAVAAANRAIRALIILARPSAATRPRCARAPGPKARKKYLQVACTDCRPSVTSSAAGTCPPSGTSSTATCTAPWSCTTGTSTTTPSTASATSFAPSTCSRDLKDAAQTHPEAIWPGQIAEALRGLIHTADLARDQGLAAVPAEMTAEHLASFRRGVTVGLSRVRRVPGAKSKQPPAGMLLECLRHREADVLRFLTDTAIPTSNQAERDLRPSKTQQKISGLLCSGEDHPRPVRHPRSVLRLPPSTDRRLHRHPRRPRRKPLDTADPGQRLNHTPKPSRTATQE